jgi:hypothetical protein
LKEKININKKCEICDSIDKVSFNKNTQSFLCQRHRKQIYKYGKIVDPRASRADDVVFIYDDYAKINIYNKRGEFEKSFVIDIEDVDKIQKYKWSLVKGYLMTKDENNQTIYLHRYILDCTDSNIVVDHINHNPLDNRKSNLRLCTNQENIRHHKIFITNTSGHTGVVWDKQRNKWLSQIVVDNKNIFLGRFENIQEAINVRKNAEKKYYKNFLLIEEVNE